MIEDETPLAKPAAEVGLRALAAALGTEVPADAVVVLQDEGTLLGQPLSCSWGPDGSQTWVADYRALANALFTVGDKGMRDAGLDPSDPTFESQARRLLRRRFPHWPEETLREVEGVLPRLQNLAMAMDNGPSDPDDFLDRRS